ncbi:MAG: Ig-like domain-containing protein, partial [Muribaculaceae bacterium]|nr:Ig-like domain-containing protein [Muribaculaceae bacterium]
TATTADGSNKSATCKITVAKTLASSISLDKTSATLKATETLTLKATIAPATTTNKSVTWKSSNEAVATVDANGKVTAVAVGETTITATTADGSNKSATCKITVAKTLATSISLDKTSATLKATETLTLKATVAPATTTDKSVTWKSSNEAVATVDANGKVTAVAVGEATITATTADGSNKSATCKISVAKTLATSISLDKTSATLKATETLTLKATVAPTTTTDKSVTWKSSNEAVATVDANGKVTAVAVGEATITATTADGSNLSATCVVTVDATLAASLILNSDEINLKVTETATLIATIYPELTTDKSVDWKSSNESVAVVDRNGVVTAIGVGTATITATTTDGTDLSASCVVNVIPTLANSIVLDITEVSLKATQTVVLTPTILPATTTDANVTWMSSDESVVIVDENGLVTAIGVGTAIITATTADGSNLSATCVVTVLPTPGDVNNDASVNVTDIVTVASYIVGKTTDVFIFEAADMTKDGSINIVDIVAIANIILSDNSESNVLAQRCAPNSSDVIKIEDFAAGKNQSQQVAIEMTNASDYSACQMDIRLPKGMSIAECELASVATDHMVAYRELPDGAVRVLVYSLTCRTLPDSEEGIIRLRTTTDNQFEGGEIVVENILFADRGQNEYRLYDSVANVNLATGVSATEVDCVVYAENQSIVIISPCDQQATISSVDGVSRTYSLNEGRNEIDAPQAGVFIVTLAGQTSKVMVK